MNTDLGQVHTYEASFLVRPAEGIERDTAAIRAVAQRHGFIPGTTRRGY